MFKQFFEVFWPKAMEYVAEQGLSNALSIKDFEHTLVNLQDNLKLLNAKAIDVEEEIKNAEDSGRKKRKREAEVWLGRYKSIKVKVDELGNEAESEGFMMKFLDGGKAAQLNGDIDKLVQQRLDIGEPVLDACGSRGETLLIDEIVGEAFTKNLETVLQILEDREVSRIGVYGMGGVGKTTLAKHIYNRLVQEYEGRVVWVTVSQEFTIKSLQDKIARFLGVKLEDEDEEAFRATRLDRFLSRKKISVLILDDVWEDIDMNKVGCTFTTECCRLVITTRSSKVCDQIGCKKLRVEKLLVDDAWELFNGTLANEIQLCPQVEEIAKSMAKLCDGLPLGIITMAGSMRGEKAIHTWKNALAELKDCVAGWHDDTGEVGKVFRVLKYSFDRLKRNHGSGSNGFNTYQHCFMYCSLFPEDYKIGRDDLVEKFILEGLLDQRRGRSRRAQVEEGLSILDKLVNVCLLESCVGDDDGEECVKMHDLVRVMTLVIAKGKYLVRSGDYSFREITNVEEWTENLEKVSLMKSSIETIGDGISPNCLNLSTLILRKNYYLAVISDSFFSKMQGLCTLDLCGTSILKMLPDSVGDLTSLKALLLENCYQLESVPYLGKLKSLRELNLSATSIKEAPHGLEELLNLRLLSINAPGLKMLPRGLLLKLGYLQHLNVPLHIQVEVEEMENLKQLEVFGGGVTNVNDFNRFIATPRTHGTCSYRIQVNLENACRLGFGKKRDLGGKNNELMLCLSNLKDVKVLGKEIAYLTISRCEGLSKWFVDDFSERLDSPASLRKLAISRCGGIEWMMSSDGQGSQIPHALEEVHLDSLDDLKGLAAVMERGKTPIGPSTTTAPTQRLVFSCLRSLFIFNCNKMRKVGLPVSGVPNLEWIEIRWCREMEEIFEEEDEGSVAASILPRLKQLILEDLPKLKKVGLPASGVPSLEGISIKFCGQIQEIFEEEEGRRAGSILTLPRLKGLMLSNLPKLKSVGRATIISNSIQTIWISKCPRLMNKLPLHFDDPTPPTTLTSIKIEREWWESLEWDITIDPNLPLLLQDFVEFL